jgi:hypothetical protein
MKKICHAGSTRFTRLAMHDLRAGYVWWRSNLRDRIKKIALLRGAGALSLGEFGPPVISILTNNCINVNRSCHAGSVYFVTLTMRN